MMMMIFSLTLIYKYIYIYINIIKFLICDNNNRFNALIKVVNGTYNVTKTNIFENYSLFVNVLRGGGN